MFFSLVAFPHFPRSCVKTTEAAFGARGWEENAGLFGVAAARFRPPRGTRLWAASVSACSRCDCGSHIPAVGSVGFALRTMGSVGCRAFWVPSRVPRHCSAPAWSCFCFCFSAASRSSVHFLTECLNIVRYSLISLFWRSDHCPAQVVLLVFLGKVTL